MRQIWISRKGGPEVLEVRQAADPTPGPGEVRIAVEAAGINFADLMARMGIYPDAPPLPCVVGYEVAGRIDAVGEGVDNSRIGEDVVGMVRFGGYSSSVVTSSLQAVRRPAGLSAVEAASLPVNGLTAWMMLEVMGRVRAGDRVLVHSAGGGVGLLALDLLKWRGAYAIGTASVGKHPFLSQRGYDQLIDYTTEDFEHVLGQGEGLDLILDPVGGDSWAKGLRLLRPGGRMIVFGFSARAQGEESSILTDIKALSAVPWFKFNPIHLMNKNIGVMGVNMGHMWEEAPRLAGWLGELLALWQQGVVRTNVHATYPFEQAAEAHRAIHGRKNTGKVVLTT